jgi:hypothetical protein
VRRYLVVDDNREFAENLAEILRGAGAEAGVALGGAEAMRRLDARFPRLPMLVVTALDGAAPLPHRGLFTKPFDTGALLEAVERLHRPGSAA